MTIGMFFNREVSTVDDPNRLDWGTWQRMTIWLTENRDRIELYEAYKADPIYGLYVNQWWAERDGPLV